jgi:hypothetical protein
MTVHQIADQKLKYIAPEIETILVSYFIQTDNMYATDNGPNFGYGMYMAGATCDKNCYDRVIAYICVDQMCMYAPISV